MNITDLYQEIILDHSKRPRNFGTLADATATSRGENPECGDTVELALKLSEDSIQDIKFTGHGCAICMASASMMSTYLRGKSKAEANADAETFLKMLTSADETGLPDAFGELNVFHAIHQFPQRVRCAALPWRALTQALNARDPHV